MRTKFAAAGLAVFLVQAQVASAEAPSGSSNGSSEGASEREFSAEDRRKAALISNQIMSPFCPGRTVAGCTSEYAAEWRREILVRVARGESAESIAKDLEGRAGKDLSGVPNRNVGYTFPIVVTIAAGLFLVGVLSWLRRDRGAPGVMTDAKAGVAPSVDDERLRSELDALDEE